MSDKTNLFVAVSIPLVLLATAAIYWPGLNGPFLLDDYVNIVSAYVPEFNLYELYYAATHNTSGTLGRPVSVLSLAISGILHGPEPWGYKFHNLVIHLITGLLIFWLLIKLMPRLSPAQSSEKSLLIAGLVASIWLLHPLMVSTVLYAVQRMAQLTSLFIIAALLVYAYARESAEEPGKRFYWLIYLALPTCFLLSFLSKENGVLIPLYIFAIEFSVYQFNFNSTMGRKRVMYFLGLFVVLPVTTGSLYLLTHLDKFTNYTVRTFDMGDRLLTQLHVVVMYLKMILLPRLSDMTLFHDYVPVTRQMDLVTAILFLLLCLAVFMIFYTRKRAPVLSFAIAWFLISHLLESTFFSLEMMFEHRNYLAAVGPLLAIVYFLSNIRAYPWIKYLNVVFLLLVVFLTVTRVQEWKSREIIYQVAISEHPDSFRAQIEMATIRYLNGYTDEAIQHLEIAKQLQTGNFGPSIHQAVIQCSTGSDLNYLFKEAEQKARLYPITVYSLNVLDNLVVILNSVGCPEISYEMVLDLLAAAKGQADNRSSELYLGILDKFEGQVYLMKGEYQRGMGLLLSAYERTGLVRILANMADVLLGVDRLEEADLVISYIKRINEESHGVETSILKQLQDQLSAAQTDRAEKQGG